MTEYVITVNEPWAAKSYVASTGGYTFDKDAAKVYPTSAKAYAEFYVLCNANTSVAKYGQVEEAWQMAKMKVTFMTYDRDVYGSIHEAESDGALHKFDMEVMDMNHLSLYAETLKRGMKLQSAVTGCEEPLLIVQMKL